jgi:hypothetical protein
MPRTLAISTAMMGATIEVPSRGARRQRLLPVCYFIRAVELLCSGSWRQSEFMYSLLCHHSSLLRDPMRDPGQGRIRLMNWVVGDSSPLNTT